MVAPKTTYNSNSRKIKYRNAPYKTCRVDKTKWHSYTTVQWVTRLKEDSLAKLSKHDQIIDFNLLSKYFSIS